MKITTEESNPDTELGTQQIFCFGPNILAGDNNTPHDDKRQKPLIRAEKRNIISPMLPACFFWPLLVLSPSVAPDAQSAAHLSLVLWLDAAPLIA